MKDLEYKQAVLPEFPKTAHLPIQPNADRDDKIASIEELLDLYSKGPEFVTIEEKIDGANSAITIVNGEPVIRNRSKILNKNYSRKDTPAKAQFAPIWNWFYENQEKFYELENILGYMPCIYGEWLYAVHTIKYDSLPSYFMPFDVYDYKEKKFVSPNITRPALEQSGFEIIPELKFEKLNEKTLLEFRDLDSNFSKEKREGIYIKVCDGEFITARYKMVKLGFIQGEHWSKQKLEKNGIKK